MGSGWARLRARGSLIPVRQNWHSPAIVAVAIAWGGYLLAQGLVAAKAVPSTFLIVAAVLLILVWSAMIVEPIVRFWLVARHLPAVQAWRLRSPSIGFRRLGAILVGAIGSLAIASN